MQYLNWSIFPWFFALWGPIWGPAVHALPSHGLAIHPPLDCDQPPPFYLAPARKFLPTGASSIPASLRSNFLERRIPMPSRRPLQRPLAIACCSSPRSLGG